MFAWGYEDMPRIDRGIVEHMIPTHSHIALVKQKNIRLRPEWALLIKEEVEKQLKVKFIEVVDDTQWLANIIPVLKKDGRVRMCIYYKDLNKAYPKDDFSLPHIDTLSDSAASSAMYSFMDGFSGYNQIMMAVIDYLKTSFITKWGVYCYLVMPFGLKNVGATYQRMATALLYDMIHKEIEVYVDEMMVKSQTREGHFEALDKFLARDERYNLILNPKKCVFRVTLGKLLGHIVSPKGIEIDPDKVKAIREMPPPKNEKEVRSFIG